MMSLSHISGHAGIGILAILYRHYLYTVLLTLQLKFYGMVLFRYHITDHVRAMQTGLKMFLATCLSK